MIAGVGLDVADIARIEAMYLRWGQRFTCKVFTERERRFAEERAEPARHYAARFAAKEAALKALSVPRRARWHDMEVLGGGSEAPRLELSGVMAEAAAALGVAHLHLSLSHADAVAAAVVIAER